MQEGAPYGLNVVAVRSPDFALLADDSEAGFWRLPNFDKRNNIPISKPECEFLVTLSSVFAQIIHICAFARKADFLPYFSGFFATAARQVIGISLRKMFAAIPNRCKRGSRSRQDRRILTRSGPSVTAGTGAGAPDHGSLKVSVEKCQGER